LGLCVDVVLQAYTQGTVLTAEDFAALPEVENKAMVLVERLLKYVNQNIKFAVHGLSACRAFDFAVYDLLGEQLKFSPTRPDFDLLTTFSFVWRTERQGQSWYKIHDLIRRINDEQRNE
jgi:hypothetical protein